MSTIKSKALEFLYKWVSEGKIPHIRKGMTEELEQFTSSILNDNQAQQTANRIAAQLESKEEVRNEEDTKQ